MICVWTSWTLLEYSQRCLSVKFFYFIFFSISYEFAGWVSEKSVVHITTLQISSIYRHVLFSFLLHLHAVLRQRLERFNYDVHLE